jgi:hypothetical protein
VFQPTPDYLRNSVVLIVLVAIKALKPAKNEAYRYSKRSAFLISFFDLNNESISFAACVLCRLPFWLAYKDPKNIENNMQKKKRKIIKSTYGIYI